MRAFSMRAMILMVLALASASNANAGGFGVYEQATRANGMGGAMGAAVDDPSAIFYNPGGLGFLRGVQGYAGVTLISAIQKYDATSGLNTESRSKIIPVPSGFASMEINDMFNFGIGVYAPYGLELAFPKGAETRYSNQLARLRTQNITPTVAIRPVSWLSIGLGGSYVTTRRLVPGTPREGIRIHQAVDLSESIFQSLRSNPLLSGTSDAALRAQARGAAGTVQEPQLRLKGDGDGFGWTAGIMAKPIKLVSLGIAYRSKVRLQLKGDAEFAGVQDPLGLPQGALTSIFIRNRISTTVVLPPSLTLGTAFHLGDKLTLAFDGTWTGWSTVDTPAIRFHTNRPVATRDLKLKWHDAWAVRAGLEYLLIGNYKMSNRRIFKAEKGSAKGKLKSDMVLALRLGYWWDESPVPVNTLSAFLPDNDRHFFSAGVGADFGRFRIDTSFIYGAFKTVRRNNDTDGVDNEIHKTQGKFTTAAVFLSVGVTVRF